MKHMEISEKDRELVMSLLDLIGDDNGYPVGDYRAMVTNRSPASDIIQMLHHIERHSIGLMVEAEHKELLLSLEELGSAQSKYANSISDPNFKPDPYESLKNLTAHRKSFRITRNIPLSGEKYQIIGYVAERVHDSVVHDASLDHGFKAVENGRAMIDCIGKSFVERMEVYGKCFGPNH